MHANSLGSAVANMADKSGIYVVFIVIKMNKFISFLMQTLYVCFGVRIYANSVSIPLIMMNFKEFDRIC